MPGTMRVLVAALLLLLSCKPTIDVNTRPAAPAAPAGTAAGFSDSLYSYTTTATDPDGDSIAVRFDWGDGDTSAWTPLAASGSTVTTAHRWLWGDTFAVRAQAVDSRGALSEWSGAASIAVTGPAPFPWVVVDSIEPSDDLELLAITPDSQYVFAGGGTYCYRARTSDNELLDSVAASDIAYDICAGPAGDYVYVASWRDELVSVIRASDNQLVGSLALGGPPYKLATDPAGEFLYALLARPFPQRGVRLVKVRTSDHTIVDSLVTSAEYESVVTSPDGSRLYASNYAAARIEVVQASDLRVIDNISVDPDPADVLLLPDGRLCVACEDGAISLVDLDEREVESIALSGFQPTWLTMTAAGDYLFALSENAEGAVVVRVSDMTPLAVLFSDKEALCRAVALPDGRMYATTDELRILVLSPTGPGEPLTMRRLVP